MSYATPAQMLQRYDARTLGDLCSDDGTQVSPSDLLSDPNLQAALDDGSGQIESSVLRGQRYQVSDLLALVAGTSNTRFTLIRLDCDIAMRLLSERRPWYELNEAYQQRLEQASKLLLDISIGKQVFDIAANQNASNPIVDTPTPQAIQNLNLVVDAARRGYYPARYLPISVE